MQKLDVISAARLQMVTEELDESPGSFLCLILSARVWNRTCVMKHTISMAYRFIPPASQNLAISALEKAKKNPELLQAWADSPGFLLLSHFFQSKQSEIVIFMLEKQSSVLNTDI